MKNQGFFIHLEKKMFENPGCSDCVFKSPATKLLTTEEIAQLEQNCAVADLKPGDTIFKQGVFSSNIVYIKHGIVKLHIEGPYKDQIIKIAKGPTYLGLPTTFDEKYYRYSATSVDKTGACFIDKQIFKQFVHKNGDFAYEIIIELCRHELNVFNKCISKSQKNARGRISDALLFFKEEIYGKTAFKLPLTRSEFGNYVDVTRESVSRILTEFHNENIIALNGRQVEILNEKLLRIISKTG
jgi:CRP/FNR family transcriptional regulator